MQRYVPRGAGRVLGETAFPEVDPIFLLDLRGWLTETPRAAVRVEVQDGTAPSATGWRLGRGLLIVRDLCPDWGVAERPAGKITWAEVPAPQAYV